jgi:hypothetical protein
MRSDGKFLLLAAALLGLLLLGRVSPCAAIVLLVLLVAIGLLIIGLLGR